MSGGRWAGLLVALVLLGSGCARLAPVLRPAPWDAYGDQGPLTVRGMAEDDPGPTIFRALRREPKLASVLERWGEPDSLEVVGGRWSQKKIVLVYRRAGRRMVVDSTPDGWVARVPEALPGASPRASAGRARPAPTAGARRPPPAPTLQQTLECPIDPERPDCRALCGGGAKHEWCR